MTELNQCPRTLHASDDVYPCLLPAHHEGPCEFRHTPAPQPAAPDGCLVGEHGVTHIGRCSICAEPTGPFPPLIRNNDDYYEAARTGKLYAPAEGRTGNLGAPTPVRKGAADLDKLMSTQHRTWNQVKSEMLESLENQNAALRQQIETLLKSEDALAQKGRKIEAELLALRQEVDRLTDTFLVCETIQPDGSLRATLKDVIRRAETTEAELESLRKERDALREKLKLS
jgi:hypothetical protein